MDMEAPDWDILDRLRTEFLNASGNVGVYWKSESDLAQYHRFFGARIGWKWDAAIMQAKRSGWKPHSRTLYDWGCGSGIATLRMIEAIGIESVDEVILWDHSTLAIAFARDRIREQYPTLKVTLDDRSDGNRVTDALCLVSHVLNEIHYEERDALSKRLANAKQIFWVEPGNHASSRMLLEQREALLGDFIPVAPCVCSQPCPMKQEDNARHWCHFFGKPPVVAFTDSQWAQFAKMMEIDLRSLPYSFLALDSKQIARALERGGASRLIGRPRQYKGYTRLYSCDEKGLNDYELQKRDDKSLWKILKKGNGESLFNWSRIEAGRIRSGSPID